MYDDPTKYICKTGLGLVYYDEASYYGSTQNKYRLLGGKKNGVPFGDLSYLNYFSDYNTSLKPTSYSGIKIFPNPFKDHIFIEGNYSEISIYDITGNLLLRTSGKTIIDVSKFANGTYIVRSKEVNGVTSSLRLIKN